MAATAAEDTALEEAAVERAVALLQTLYSGASNLASGTLPNGKTLRVPGATARLLTSFVTIHSAELEALGSPVTAATATATETATATATSSGADEITSFNALVTREWVAARTLLRDLTGLNPEFALLLCRTAAACSVNADRLRAEVGGKSLGTLKPAAAEETSEASATATAEGTATPTATGTATTLSDEEVTALNRLLAGEHAAFYAYPLVIAHTDSAHREVASDLWEAHRQQRNELERLLLAAGATPAEAGAAYEVSTPASPAKASALAAKIERRLAGLAADVLAVATDGTAQTTGADLLIVGTRRQSSWTGQVVAEPGT